MKSRNIFNESTFQTSKERLTQNTSVNNISLSRTTSDFNSSFVLKIKKGPFQDKLAKSLEENLQKQINNEHNNQIIKNSMQFMNKDLDFFMSDFGMAERNLNFQKRKMIVEIEKQRLQKLAKQGQKINTVGYKIMSSTPKSQQQSNSRTRSRNQQLLPPYSLTQNSSREKQTDLTLSKQTQSTKEVGTLQLGKRMTIRDLQESRRISLLKKNLTIINVENGEEVTTTTKDQFSPDKITVDPLIDQSVANKKGVIPKMFYNFKKQMDQEKIKQRVEIQDDYVRLKIKMIQKAKKINLMSTSSKENNNLIIPCKIKPRKAEIKIIKPHLSNIRYAVLLNNSPLVDTNSTLKREILNYSQSTEIKPSPNVLHSFKIPRTEVCDIQNNLTLMRTKPKYNSKIPIPYSNHHLPPKPYVKAANSHGNNSLTKKSSRNDKGDKSARGGPKLSSRSRSNNVSPFSDRSNRSQGSNRSARSARSLNNSQTSHASNTSFRRKQIKTMQKIYLNKSIKDFRKQLEGILTDQKRKMQDIEIQNSYFKELANISQQVNKIFQSENLYAVQKKMSRSFTKKELLDLQTYKTPISIKEDQNKMQMKDSIRDKLCKSREQGFALQELLFYLKKVKKQMKRDKAFKQKFSKEKSEFREIDESIDLANILKKKIQEIQKQLYNESQQLLDTGIDVCKDDVANPLKFQNAFSNQETEKFVRQIFEDENNFLKKVKLSMIKFNRAPSLERKLKRSLLNKAELEMIRKQKEEQERKRQQMGNNIIFQAFTKKIAEVQSKMAPLCLKPSALDLNAYIENFKLDTNYFEPVNPSLSHLQQQFNQISVMRSRKSISMHISQMMHEWKSQERLLEEYDHLQINDPLKYEQFHYDTNEWDNVPQVIPRFSFYLQQYVKGISSFCHGKGQEETTANLRKEIMAQIKRLDGRIDQEHQARQQNQDKVQSQIEDLQKQIDIIVQESDEFREEIKLKSKEHLLTEKYLSKGDISSYQFEQDLLGSDLQAPHLNTPRMITIRQMRDVFYSLWNISFATTRIKEAEMNIEKIQTKCYKLSYDDEQLSNRINNNNTTYLKTFDEITKDIKQNKVDNERKFSDFFHRIQNNFESIKKLKQYAEEQKMFQEMIVNKSESIISRVNKIRDNIMDELKKAQTEFKNKFEETDKYYGEQMEITQSQIDKQKVLQKELLLRTKEDLQQSLKNESAEIKKLIEAAKEEIYNDRGNIQSKFDEKLRKIKEICSQYFNKYEKELLNNQEKMKELDLRCDEWAKLIVQPQELNQARLFAIETRMKESEEYKVREVTFMKDTLKKLIFAMEQSEFQRGSSTNKRQMVHSVYQSNQFIQDQASHGSGVNDLSSTTQVDRAQTTLKPSKFSQQNNLTIDGEPMNVPLPNLMALKNRGQSTVRSAIVGTRLRDNSSQVGERMSNASTGIDYQSTLPTYDILFLKRLLFLKASIDQEHTNDSYKVPIVSAPPLINKSEQSTNMEKQPLLNRTFGPNDMNLLPLDQLEDHSSNPFSGTNRAGTTQLFQDRRKRQSQPTNDSTGLRLNSNPQKSNYEYKNSIDLQDYLDYQTGLDYQKLKIKNKLDHSRKVKSSQVSTREPKINISNNNNNDLNIIDTSSQQINDQNEDKSQNNQNTAKKQKKQAWNNENSLLKQIERNKYISDRDYEIEREQAEEIKRKQRIQEAQYPKSDKNFQSIN